MPGLAAISITGLMGIPLGNWLLFGLVLGPLTAVLTTFVMKMMLRTNYWKPESDESEPVESEFAEVAVGEGNAESGSGSTGSVGTVGSAGAGGNGGAGTGGATPVGGAASEQSKARELPLFRIVLANFGAAAAHWLRCVCRPVRLC